jgi:AcrR family transcriptional regulator
MDRSGNVKRVWGAKTAEERRNDRRTTFMRAAVATYGAVGFRNSTVKSVCAAAGLTERYFYESFDSSEQLLQACFQEVTKDIMAMMLGAASGVEGDAFERVRAGLLVYFKEIRKNPEAARVFLLEMVGVSAATDAVVASSLDAFGKLLVKELQGDRPDRRPPSPLLLRGVVGGGLHIAQAWMASGYAAPVEEVTDVAMRLYRLVEGD